ncbi:NUDIX hydrolase [Malikia spinosa]|uniref:NUDIX hydrolase n=1 Tax=Malikia spinosa TaxID=86180 RepID=A0A2S9KIE6_9BURK|nr:NUDIX hydrolase [Malikia spinosa]PRD70212.1 NUDIX hydrolase [Malikia spinosa]
MNPTETERPPRDAASLVLLRDGSAGLEVLLLRRHADSRVMGGVHVFPGGKLDPTDCSPDALAALDLEAEQLLARLDEPALTPEKAAGLHLAALRETFEEAGLLLADNADAAARQALADRQTAGEALADAMAALGLRWQASAILPWSRWITPRHPASGAAFDTRFFLARLPTGQEARHDGYETTEAVWLAPRQALTLHAEHRLELVPPQLMSLVKLARHATVDSAWNEALAARPPRIQPEASEVDGERLLYLPGDPLHSVRERALPGPTRLHWLPRRFEPVGGFAAWFD